MLKDVVLTICEYSQNHPYWTFIVVIILFCIYYTIYLPVTSPLWKVPGPHLYRITKIPYLNHQRKGSWIGTVYNLHLKYGPVVILSPTEISCNGSSNFINDIYLKNLPKSKFYENFTNHGSDNIFATLANDKHKNYKKIINKLYNKSNIFSFENNTRTILINTTRSLIKVIYDSSINGKNPDNHTLNSNFNPHGKSHKEPNWYNKSKQIKNLSMDVFTLFGALAMDVVSKFELGENNGTNLIENPKEREVILKHRQVSGMGFWTTLMPQFFWDFAANKIVLQAFKDITNFQIQLYEFAEKNYGKNGKNLTTLETLKKNGLRGNKAYSFLSDNLFAGHETTAVQLCYLTYELSRPGNANILKNLQMELFENFGKPQDSNDMIIDLEKVDSLPFLNSLILENSRVHSSIPGAEPRVLDKDYHIDQFKIPIGTTISCLPYALHREPKIFPKHDEFIPERWLKYSEENEQQYQERIKLQNKFMMPFGKGIRMCLGMQLALIEMKLTIANIYWHFNTKLDQDWCEIEPILKPIKLGLVNCGENNYDFEKMTMFDFYTINPINDECWLRFYENS
ncbi:uncharacterized protein KGF55_001327 [Candida pseudojiufengensis]|uniref:uncharacterized protein n=1 Tax=Candida pseudojiufengensis TaxID=497109 RepID=UPI0022242790|nr:uncharacterized protein KGF55_001327 [Candida pseudojiufengensis]KAI5965963.1 hypothetical protein KGF55_001327 [Candida pseudojiufengensis]